MPLEATLNQWEGGKEMVEKGGEEIWGTFYTPLLKNLRVCAVFPSSLVSSGSPRDRTLNSGRLAQPCFWHFVSQRALEHLLGWEREGSMDCTLET